ncbi:transposase [Streptomyces sp. 5-10]|nr:transposase [Streptomyces sp. 5-10]
MSAALSKRVVPDALWELVAPLLPSFAARPQGGGTAPCDERAVFTAVVYVLTTGCAWRHLPPTFGTSPATAHRRFHPRHPVPPGATATPPRQTPRGQGVLFRRTPGLAARAWARRAHRAARRRVRREFIRLRQPRIARSTPFQSAVGGEQRDSGARGSDPGVRPVAYRRDGAEQHVAGASCAFSARSVRSTSAPSSSAPTRSARRTPVAEPGEADRDVGFGSGYGKAETSPQP